MHKKNNGWVRILNRNLLKHLLFWGISFAILLHVFSLSGKINRLDFIYTILFHIGLFTGVYINLIILFPYFLKKHKYYSYGIFLIIDILFSSEISLLAFKYLSGWLFPGYYLVAGYGFSGFLIFQLIYIGLTTLLELSSAWFRLAESEKSLIQAEKDKVFFELKALSKENL